MFAGLASPSHLIIVLVLVLLLLVAKRIPELAKHLGTGIRDLRAKPWAGDALEAEAHETLETLLRCLRQQVRFRVLLVPNALSVSF